MYPITTIKMNATGGLVDYVYRNYFIKNVYTIDRLVDNLYDIDACYNFPPFNRLLFSNSHFLKKDKLSNKFRCCFQAIKHFKVIESFNWFCINTYSASFFRNVPSFWSALPIYCAFFFVLSFKVRIEMSVPKLHFRSMENSASRISNLFHLISCFRIRCISTSSIWHGNPSHG